MPIDQSDTATAMLREEHTLILEVTSSMASTLEDERAGNPLDFDQMARYITFLRLFADACHHSKEEDHLFPGLEAMGMPRDGGPIGVMLYEHEQGRILVRTMATSLEEARAGDAASADALRDAAGGFIQLIVAHIDKENHVLFNMADGMIVGPECQELCAKYDEVCSRRFEGQTKEDLERLADEILGR